MPSVARVVIEERPQHSTQRGNHRQSVVNGRCPHFSKLAFNESELTYTRSLFLILYLFLSASGCDSKRSPTVGVDEEPGWVRINTTELTQTLRDVQFVDGQTGFAVGDSGTILKTTDGGKVWNRQNGGTVRHLYGVCFTDAKTGHVIGARDAILRTTNGGHDWVNSSLGVGPDDVIEI